jgi:hypothetical protein
MLKDVQVRVFMVNDDDDDDDDDDDKRNKRNKRSDNVSKLICADGNGLYRYEITSNLG